MTSQASGEEWTLLVCNPTSLETQMTKNMSTADRLIRTLIAIGIAVLYYTGHISGRLAIILGVVAVVFLLSSFVGRCPGYLLLGLSTHKEPPGSPGA